MPKNRGARRPKLVAMPHVSNALGTIVDVERWTRAAKAAGATVMIDGAQSAPHLPVNAALANWRVGVALRWPIPTTSFG